MRAVIAVVTPAAVATAAFVITRDKYRLEDAAFVEALAAFSGAAAVAAALSSVPRRRGAGAVARAGLFGAAAVPALFVAYIVARLALCILGIGECYGN